MSKESLCHTCYQHECKTWYYSAYGGTKHKHYCNLDDQPQPTVMKECSNYSEHTACEHCDEIIMEVKDEKGNVSSVPRREER